MLIALVAASVVATAPTEVAHRRVVASDGVSLALYRYGAPGNPPVLLIPDLFMSRAVFDIEGEGLARYLAEHGRTAYVAELRGQGAAAVRDARLEDLVRRDLPAIIDVVGNCDLVAYGYAGTLAMAATTRELKGRVNRVVAISTPVEPDAPSRLLVDSLAHQSDLATGPAFDLLFAMNGRFKRGRLEALRAHAFTPLGVHATVELAEWLRSGDLALGDGTTVHGRLADYDRPTLLFLGLADTFAGPELATPLPQISKADVRMRTFSRFELAHEDYSHLSLVQGENARIDVFEPALRFLQ